MNYHYFIGIPLPEKLNEELILWQENLASFMTYKSWTHRDDFHITLKFLGEGTDNTIRELASKLMNVNWPSPFSIRIGPADAFGNEKRPRVFFADVQPNEELTVMKNSVEELCGGAGWKKETRSYHPHVTLAKKKADGESPLLHEPVPEIFKKQYECMVERFHIYMIHPGKRPSYEKWRTILL